jgi:hypothetical protein
MALPVFVGINNAASSVAAGTSGAVANVQAGDLILLYIATANELAVTPSGFTIAPQSPQGTGTAGVAGGVRLSVFYRFATGADTSTSIADAGDHFLAIKIAIRGVDQINPFNASASRISSASTSVSFPGLTTTDNDCFIVLAFAGDTDSTSQSNVGTLTNASLSNITQRLDFASANGSGSSLGIFTGTKATAGAVSNTTGTSPDSVIRTYITLALSQPSTKIVADPATYTYTGTAANTLRNRKVIADPATYTYTGTAANTLRNRKVIADPGTYSYTGTAANTLRNRKVIADPGTYSYTGTDATLSYATQGAYTLLADAGTYTYAGTDASLSYTTVGGYFLLADAGTYSYTGTAASTLYNRKAVADPGTYSYTGTAASTLYNRKAVADAGTYSYTGTGASTLLNRKAIADAGTYSYTGTDVALTYVQGKPIYIGAVRIKQIYLGTTPINRLYIGTTQVF